MKKVLFSGFFDVLHSGHLFSIIEAKKYGEYLIINISPDKRAREKKGPGRPYMSEKERLFIVSQIKGVDEVVCVGADDNMKPEAYTKKFLSEIRPDVFVYAYEHDEIQRHCDSLGIKLIYLPEISGIDGAHSTDIINKINHS